MGDMMVSGHNILAKYESFAGSHDLNYKLTSKLLSDSKNYDLVAVEELQSRAFAKSFA
jgi:UDP-3-O-[3-hydroxymyristoyl] N-acetylglucosamine deacetylase